MLYLPELPRARRPATMTKIDESVFGSLRREMLEQIALHATHVSDRTGKVSLDERVIAVMGEVPRHEFVPAELRPLAYIDNPLPIGFGKTISQPFIVALMTDLLDVQSDDRVLEIGTGLGYQAAVLAGLASTVYSVEMIDELSCDAALRLGRLGYDNIELQVSDGSLGWPGRAPFDKIIATAAPELIPPPLLNQLKPAGRMVIPAGMENAQQLLLLEKDAHGHVSTTDILRVRFSTMMSSH
jgi:protein-L-isoaspartate(D-aspartate) O-methyltransferase